MVVHFNIKQLLYTVPTVLSCLLDLGRNLHANHILAVLIPQLPLDNDTDLRIGLQNRQTRLVLVSGARLDRALDTGCAGIGVLEWEGHFHTRDNAMNNGGEG